MFCFTISKRRTRLVRRRVQLFSIEILCFQLDNLTGFCEPAAGGLDFQHFGKKRYLQLWTHIKNKSNQSKFASGWSIFARIRPWNRHSAWVHYLKFSPGLEFWKNAAQRLESFRSALRFSFFCFQLIQQQDEQSGRHVSQIVRLTFDLSCTIHMLESTELELVHSRAPGFTEPFRGGKVWNLLRHAFDSSRNMMSSKTIELGSLKKCICTKP